MLSKPSTPLFRSQVQPIFSLCHSTARLPDGWKQAHELWLSRCDHPEAVEYVITIDKARTDEGLPVIQNYFAEEASPGRSRSAQWCNVRCAINEGRQSAVDGWNTSAQASTGQFLITVADDWEPCEHWDTELIFALTEHHRKRVLSAMAGDFQKNPLPPKALAQDSNPLDFEYVVDVRTQKNDTRAGVCSPVLLFSMMTRPYYKRYSRIFHPDYIGMFADNDFTEQVKADGVVVDARHLLFPHSHPAYGTAKHDDVYAWQHREEAWAKGKETLLRRWPGSIPERVCVAFPGNNFSGAWVAHFLTTFSHIIQHYACTPMNVYSSNVHVTRAAIAKAFLDSGYNSPSDYLLSIDDDNILTAEQFEMLMDDLKRHPDLDGVYAWSWIASDTYEVAGDALTSAGRENFLPMTYEELMGGPSLPELFEAGEIPSKLPLRPVTHSGFPAVLLRRSALVKAGGWCAFIPVLTGEMGWGFLSEDASFNYNAVKGGAKFAVDRRIKVPHLKVTSREPKGFDPVAHAKQFLAGPLDKVPVSAVEVTEAA